MINSRDLEQLSAYLDGQLSPSDSARLESRISSDTELASALQDIRSARGILRKLPGRKAPRNFTLTRQMVGLKPPLPRSYSFFRFSSAFAAVLLIFTFAANALTPRPNFSPTASAYSLSAGSAAASQAPAAAEVPAVQAPSIQMPLAATRAPAANADTNQARESTTPAATMLKGTETNSAPQDQVQPQGEVFVPLIWQIILLVITLGCAVTAFLITQNAKKKWR
jgi:anti-sigma factor RsiW